MEYYNNYDLKDILYFCESDAVWKVEQWKDIPNYEGHFKISDLGRVKSLYRWLPFKNSFRSVKEKIRVVHIDKKGYCYTSLNLNSLNKVLKIHQLMAITFLNHKPCGYDLVIDHKNEIKTDNRLVNLQLLTHRKNISKSKVNKSGYTGVRKSNSRFRAETYINGKYIHIGTYNTPEEANEAYKNKINE